MPTLPANQVNKLPHFCWAPAFKLSETDARSLCNPGQHSKKQHS